MEKLVKANIMLNKKVIIHGYVSEEVRKYLIRLHNETLNENVFKIDVRSIDEKTGDSYVVVEIIMPVISFQTSGGFTTDQFPVTK